MNTDTIVDVQVAPDKKQVSFARKTLLAILFVLLSLVGFVYLGWFGLLVMLLLLLYPKTTAVVLIVSVVLIFMIPPIAPTP